MRLKKWIAAILCMGLLAGSLAGCGKGGDGGGEAGTDDSGEPQKGRYVETEEALPEQLAGWEVQQIFILEDKVHLLAVKKENNKLLLTEWAQQENGFADVTPDWLKNLELSLANEWTETKLLSAEDGTQYLLAGYVAEGEEEYKSHLWKGGEGGAVEITPQEWNVVNDWGGYAMISAAAVLDNGTLAAVNSMNLEILSGEDGRILESGQITEYYDAMISDGGNVYLYAQNSVGSASIKLEKCKDGKTGGSESIIFDKGVSGIKFCALSDGTLVAAGEDGIFRGTQSAGNVEWEMLMQGVETDFALSGRWCVDLTATVDGKIYAIFRTSEGGNVLRKYEFDPEAVIEVKETLRLYTVYDNSILKQAAVSYHKEHPEVLITVESVYPMYYYDETDYNAVYQELNTMLLGENAPDILVMDHLDMDSYAEKGLLEDINDVLNPMEESGEILSNITKSYIKEDGKRYVVPLQFAFSMVLGRDISAGDMESMEKLAAFLSGADYNYMGGLTVSELVDRFYPYFCNEIVRDKQLDREILGTYLDYLKAMSENCGILASRDENERAFNMWELASEAKLAFYEADGFNGSMAPIAMVDYVKGEFAAFENNFIPSMQMGICSKSKYKDTAKDFLRHALSETVQDTDYYSGFPVNSASLEKLAGRDRSDAEAETAIEVDGSYVEFTIKDFPPETAQKLVEICKGLNRPAGEDDKIREVLIEALEGYFNGGQSRESTLQKVEDGLKMYLAE